MEIVDKNLHSQKPHCSHNGHTYVPHMRQYTKVINFIDLVRFGQI